MPRRAPETGGAIGNLRFTVKEWTMLELIAQGVKFPEIGRRLGRQEGTIRNWAKQLYDRTGQSSRLELALWFLYKTGRLDEMREEAGKADAALVALSEQVQKGELRICFG